MRADSPVFWEKKKAHIKQVKFGNENNKNCYFPTENEDDSTTFKPAKFDAEKFLGNKAKWRDRFSA